MTRLMISLMAFGITATAASRYVLAAVLFVLAASFAVEIGRRQIIHHQN